MDAQRLEVGVAAQNTIRALIFKVLPTTLPLLVLTLPQTAVRFISLFTRQLETYSSVAHYCSPVHPKR